jgi:hypothetical protein
MLRSPDIETDRTPDADGVLLRPGAADDATAREPERTRAARTWPSRGVRLGAAAFGLYLAASLLLWGVHVLPHMGSTYLSATNVNDQRFYQWALAWWPYAIGHGLNPLHTSYLWAPGGVNLTWVTSLAGPAILLSPVTLVFGPLVSENMLFLLAPALAAWAAYLVCMRITERFLPSIAGGYLFGFSTYVVGQMQGHLNLVLVFPIPLVLYLAMRRLQGGFRRWAFVVLLAATLVLQFSISTEVFATMTLVGLFVLVAAYVFGPRPLRPPLRVVGFEAAAAYGIALLLVVPYLVSALGAPPSQVPWEAYRPYLARYSTDLTGTVVPRTFTLIGGGAAEGVTSRFVTSPFEDGSYFGIPLLLAVALAVFAGRRRRWIWLAAGTFLVAAVMSLGPVLHVSGTPSIWLPWSLAARLPIVGVALPSRLIVYAWLAAAVLVAWWLATAHATGAFRRIRPAARWILAGAAAVAILPAVAPSAHVESPAVFSNGALSRYIRPGDTVLSLPFYTPNSMMLWQVESGFSFRLAGGYIGWRAIPVVDRADRATHGLIRNEPGRTPPWALRAFILRHHVNAIILSRYARNPWRTRLHDLQLRPIHMGPLLLYRIPPDL